MLIPLRCSIMKVLIENPDGLTPDEIYERLDDGYKKERQCTPKRIDDHLMSMKGVSIVEVRDTIVNDDDTITIRYAFTDYGYTTAKRWFPDLFAGVASKEGEE